MPESNNDLSILNASLGGEYFGIAAYDAALGTGLLDEGVVPVARKFQEDHRAHAGLLKAAIEERGGTPVEPQSWETYAAEYPPPPLNNQEDILRYAASLEQSGASADVRSVGALSSPELRRLAASIGGVEAMHWSVLLGALGEDPVPVSVIPEPVAVS